MYEILRKIESLFNLNESNADRKDIMRSATTAASLHTWVQVIRMLGHETEHGDWEDEGCLRTGYLKIDDSVIIYNSKFNYDEWLKLCKKYKEEK